MAFANTKKINQAKAELVELSILRNSEAVKTQMIWEINTTADVVEIAYNVLQGEIARIEGKNDKAVQFFQKGVELEDQLVYNEPPNGFSQ